MNDEEKMLSSLARDIAVVVNSQKSCQAMQEKTTKNIDKLTTNLSKLVIDHIKLDGRVEDIQAIKDDIASLQKNQRWGVVTVLGIVIIAFIKIIVEYTTKGI